MRANNGTAYALSGPQGAPVVVLIHGLGLNRHMWRAHEAALAARYRVLNYDLFGHGESAPPAAKPSLLSFARQLLEVLDELGIARPAIVGFSLGGMINRRFAMAYPDRVSALAILNSPHERSPAAQKLVAARAAKIAKGGTGATIDATLERWFTAEFRAARPDVVRRVRAWVVGNDPASYGECRRVLADGVVELLRPWPPITKPALAITCENDSGSTPAMSYHIAAEIPGAQALVVPHLRHLGLVERPSLFIEPILAFLDTIPAQCRTGRRARAN